MIILVRDPVLSATVITTPLSDGCMSGAPPDLKEAYRQSTTVSEAHLVASHESPPNLACEVKEAVAMFSPIMVTNSQVVHPAPTPTELISGLLYVNRPEAVL